MSDIVKRIERAAGVPDLATILAERLSPTDLQSLLLEVYRRRVGEMAPAQVLDAYLIDRFVRPASVSPDCLNRWERVVFDTLMPEFEVLALSSVCPLGTSSVVAGIDQNWVMATARNSEVVSDTTNVLALECAVRRRALLREKPKSAQPVHLAARQRVVRAQRFERPHMVSHFNLLGLVSAGRDRGSYSTECEALLLHVRMYLTALKSFLGSKTRFDYSVTAFDSSIGSEFLEARLLAPIQAQFADVTCRIDPKRTAGGGYYRGVAFHIHALTQEGSSLNLVDGGDVDWTQKYLSNAKERLVVSGLGGERVCFLKGQ